MIDSRMKEILWNRFGEFIDPDSDRFTLLREILKESALEYRVLSIAGNRHFFLAPHSGAPLRRPTILVAHYDRAQGSPGANDNGAGVFMLIETAANLNLQNEDNWAIILTDKEELKSGESIRNQGAYTLAQGLREMNMENARIFSFDACGTGNTLIISSTAEYLLKGDGGGERLRSAFHDLQKTALKAAHDLGTAKYVLIPTPFSDDAGFLRAGIAAQTITMLPSQECSTLAAALKKNPRLTDALVSRRELDDTELKQIPETWKNMNSSNDTYAKLTPENFRTVIRFAGALCKL